ncbi:GGDEF-domain containing protein [Sesbania bispinosa]|nr:GGDEF-domain containing protein [Sesbania bispinosa]
MGARLILGFGWKDVGAMLGLGEGCQPDAGLRNEDARPMLGLRLRDARRMLGLG